MQPAYQPKTSISCNVIDRRAERPACGLHAIIRCTNIDGRAFKGTTNEEGFILWWEPEEGSRVSLLQYIFDHQGLDQMCWHMQFNTSGYFYPIVPQYNFADINFVIRREDHAPNIFLYADITGFGTWVQASALIHPLQKVVMTPTLPHSANGLEAVFNPIQANKPPTLARSTNRLDALRSHAIHLQSVEKPETVSHSTQADKPPTQPRPINLSHRPEPSKKQHKLQNRINKPDVFKTQKMTQSIRKPLPRVKFSPAQSSALKSHFVDEPYPDKYSLQRISDGLHLRSSQTRSWFERNRSRAFKKEETTQFVKEFAVKDGLERIHEENANQIKDALMKRDCILEEGMEQNSTESSHPEDKSNDMDCRSSISSPSVGIILEKDLQSTPDHTNWWQTVVDAEVPTQMPVLAPRDYPHDSISTLKGQFMGYIEEKVKSPTDPWPRYMEALKALQENDMYNVLATRRESLKDQKDNSANTAMEIDPTLIQTGGVNESVARIEGGIEDITLAGSRGLRRSKRKLGM